MLVGSSKVGNLHRDSNGTQPNLWRGSEAKCQDMGGPGGEAHQAGFEISVAGGRLR